MQRIERAALDGYLCRPETPIREVMARIDASPHLFQLVVDAGNRVGGTVTDGDIRRAILRGTDPAQPASACMNPKPVLGTAGESHANREKLERMLFLPIVDACGVLEEVLVPDGGASDISVALVMAGGLGARLGSRTDRTPKPMLPIRGTPILGHILDRLEAVGVVEIYVAVHYLKDQVVRFLDARASRANYRVIAEETQLGTAGALGLLPSGLRDPLLVINGDVMTDVDLAAMSDFHNRHAYDGPIAVASHEIEVPYGVVRHGDDGLFVGIDEKPRIRQFVAAGIYYLAPEFRALVPPGKPFDMPELLNQGRAAGLKLGLFPIHEYWQDVGRPADLDSASRRQ